MNDDITPECRSAQMCWAVNSMSGQLHSARRAPTSSSSSSFSSLQVAVVIGNPPVVGWCFASHLPGIAAAGIGMCIPPPGDSCCSSACGAGAGTRTGSGHFNAPGEGMLLLLALATDVKGAGGMGTPLGRVVEIPWVGSSMAAAAALGACKWC